MTDAVDNGDKYMTGVVDTGEKCMTGVVDIGDTFMTGVNEYEISTGRIIRIQNSCNPEIRNPGENRYLMKS